MIQEKIVYELTIQAASVGDVDLARADRLVVQRQGLCDHSKPEAHGTGAFDRAPS